MEHSSYTRGTETETKKQRDYSCGKTPAPGSAPDWGEGNGQDK